MSGLLRVAATFASSRDDVTRITFGQPVSLALTDAVIGHLFCMQLALQSHVFRSGTQVA
jgi:hypothetical protein